MVEEKKLRRVHPIGNFTFNLVRHCEMFGVEITRPGEFILRVYSPMHRKYLNTIRQRYTLHKVL